MASGMTYTRWIVAPLQEGCGSQRERERALVQELLCRLMDGECPRLEHDSNGAPYLPDYPNLFISISHCRRAVAVAVSPMGKVGIDVECRRRIDGGLVRRVCSDSEREEVEISCDKVMAFLRLWTRKEAVLKMRGTGIRGFGSMVHALDDASVVDLNTGIPDVVAALATGV